MKILLLGSQGQLGIQLRRSLALLGEVVALHRTSDPCGDLAQPDALAATVRAVRPQVIVNAAAYTAVDKAETERDTAFAINATACEVLAREAAQLGAWLVHYSTDYVFAGDGTTPWRETDPTGPVNLYGASKLEGERAITRGTPRHLVFRCSWVFDTCGQNFLKSILRAAMNKDALDIVSDQWGAPTRAALIADVTAHALARLRDDNAGVYHLAPAGETNWHAYASLAVAHAIDCGMNLRTQPGAIHAIAASQYPVPARRPANSRLDTSKLRAVYGLQMPPWQDGVRAVVAELAAGRALGA